MWGNWMDKAKDLAANLDKQLNESVGMEADRSLASRTASSMSISGALGGGTGGEAAVTSTTSDTGGGGGIIESSLSNDNVWNDDFDAFDDDEDDHKEGGHVHESSSQQQEQEKEKEVTLATMATAVITSPILAVSSPAIPSVPSPIQSPIPSSEIQPSSSSLKLEPDAVNVQTTSNTTTLENVEDGWDAQEQENLLDDEYDIDNDNVEVEEEETFDLQQPPPQTKQQQSFLSSKPHALFAASTSMLSNFAHRAEVLVHQAEAVLPHPHHHPHDDDDHNQGQVENHDDESSSPLSKRPLVSSLFSSIPKIGLSSKQNVHDDNNELEEQENEKQMDGGGWEEGEDLDLENDNDHDHDDDNNIQVVVGTEQPTTTNKEPMDTDLAVTASKSASASMPQEIGDHVAAESSPVVVEKPPVIMELSVPGETATNANHTKQLPDSVVVVPLETETNLSKIADPTMSTTTGSTAPIAAPPPPTQSDTTTTNHNTSTLNIEDDPRYQELKQQLVLRESQLASKAEQLTQLQIMMENQEHELKQKIQETKEEAKKRIMRAKERCEAAEAKLQHIQSQSGESAASQAQLIAELRGEGEKLARKQSQMEQAVRAAKGETRELTEKLQFETSAKEQALEKNAKLEAELKSTKESLAAARKGESQAGKLESDLLAVRSDAEIKATTILTLSQQIKELMAESKELEEEIERTRKAALQEAQQEKKTLRREHNDVIADLEARLRTTEREAGVREDALRHEVSELRKRWQDAVRRADALSMDVQSSTAPLLRQLESMERQNRARAANWAELENRLRSELEETVIQNETLSKERSEFKTKYTRLERSMNEREQELKQSKRIIEDQTAKITKMEAELAELQAEAEKRQEEYAKVERLANEGVMRVRSEMTQTVVDSEERYRGQIEKLEGELRIEREKRRQLEKQVEQLLENSGMIVAPQAPDMMNLRRESKPQKLRKAEGQAEILAGALGLEEDSDDESDEDDEILGHSMDRGESSSRRGSGTNNPQANMNSFAALEQLSSRLKVAKIELEALRANLRESEKTRESLVQELGESRTAKEKLPLFEAKVKELTQDNKEKELEIQGLRDDIAEVRELYRTQLNLLLEEKASKNSPTTVNGTSDPPTKELLQQSLPEEIQDPPMETAPPDS